MSDREITTAFDKLRRLNNLTDPGNQKSVHNAALFWARWFCPVCVQIVC